MRLPAGIMESARAKFGVVNAGSKTAEATGPAAIHCKSRVYLKQFAAIGGGFHFLSPRLAVSPSVSNK
jgi:hypothetical protein